MDGSHNNDTGLCRAILGQLPSHVDCLYVDEDLSSQELRLLVGDLRFLVASRFHSMISALAIGVPPLTLGWGRQKYLEVLETFDLGELYLDYAEADLNEVRRRIDLIEAEYERIEGQINQGLSQLLAIGSRLGAELIEQGTIAPIPVAPDAAGSWAARSEKGGRSTLNRLTRHRPAPRPTTPIVPTISGGWAGSGPVMLLPNLKKTNSACAVGRLGCPSQTL